MINYKIIKSYEDKIVYIYKVKQGVELDNRAWDIGNYARSRKRAKELLKIFQGKPFEEVVRCINWCVKYFKENNLTWTLETINMYAWRYLDDRNKEQDEAKKRFEQLLKMQELKKSFIGDKI
jgi:hypothetical protein